MKTDPVCGQTIDPLRARAVAIVDGQTFYFCSVDHKRQYVAKRILADPVLPAASSAVPVPLPPMETGPTPLPILAEGSPIPRPPAAPPAQARFEIGGMTNPDDAERVRKAIARVPGVLDIELDPVSEVATLAVERGRFAPAALVESVATAGYEAAPKARTPEEDLRALARRARRDGWQGAALVALSAALTVFLRGLLALVPAILALAGLALVGRALQLRARHAAAAAIASLDDPTTRAAVLELQTSSAPLLRLAARARRWAVPIGAAAALLVAGALLLLGHSWIAALGVVAAATPAGPALATRAAFAIAAASAARRGAVFRNAEAFERAGDVGLVVVDIHSTLTEGRPHVAAHAAAAGTDSARLVALAAAAEQMSEAPLALALRAYAADEGVPVPLADRASFAPGLGVAATVAGTEVVVGSRRLLEEQGVPRVRLDALAGQLGRRSGVFVAIDGQLAGALAVDEPLRPEVPRFVAGLRALGVRVAVVTGDGEAAARAVADEAGIGEVFANLSPEDKKRIIVGLRGQRAVAVVGDGVADETALTAADVGIALGRGADPARAAAAVTVARGDLDGVLAALACARRGVAVMRGQLKVVIGHAALALAATIALAPPPIAVVLSTAAVLLWMERRSVKA